MELQSFRKPPVPAGGAGAAVSSARDLTNEPVLNMEGIQADILLGHSKKAEAAVFFKILSVQQLAAFMLGLPITSAAQVFRSDPSVNVSMMTGEAPPNPRFSVAFSLSGLNVLSRNPGTAPLLEPLEQRLSGRAVTELNDADPTGWIMGRPDDDIDGVFIITGAEEADVDNALANQFGDPASSGFAILDPIMRGNVRPGDNEGHEHFSFLDGVSQPGLRGCVDASHTVPLTMNDNPNDPNQGLPGQDLLWPGEFVLGYPTQIPNSDFREKGEPVVLPSVWMKDGSFLVIRRLTQQVPEMHAAIKAATPQGQTAEQLEAQIVGRWPNGAPIISHPNGDDASLGTDPLRNNDFEFEGDRNGLTCPWAAHIRKAYPRDDVFGNVAPSEDEGTRAEGSTQTHRMLRRGIQFGPEVTEQENSSGHTTQDRGLLFKCYVSDLARQFEFVQKSWCNADGFVQPGSGVDSIIGQMPLEAARTFAGVGYPNLKPSFDFPPWVKMTGGGYFFAPSIDFLKSLEGSASV